MIKYFLKALEAVDKLFEYHQEDKCRKCEHTETCELQSSKLCGYDKDEANK